METSTGIRTERDIASPGARIQDGVVPVSIRLASEDDLNAIVSLVVSSPSPHPSVNPPRPSPSPSPPSPTSPSATESDSIKRQLLEQVFQRKDGLAVDSYLAVISSSFVKRTEPPSPPSTMTASTSPHETIVGFAAVLRTAPDLPGRGSELLTLWVAPEYRRRGVARSLLHNIRRSYQCESWARLVRSEAGSHEWLRRQGYSYHHTQVGSSPAAAPGPQHHTDGVPGGGGTATRSVYRWPGAIRSRPAVEADLDEIHALFVRSVFENPGIQHGTKVPDDFRDTVRERLFASGAQSKSNNSLEPSPPTGQAQATVYYTTSGSPTVNDSTGRPGNTPHPSSTRIVGVVNMHTVTPSSTVPGTPDAKHDGIEVGDKAIEINMFFTDTSLGAKDLGHAMMVSGVLERHGAEYEVQVQTWTVNHRAIGFYRKHGFVERRREDEEETRRSFARPAKVLLVRPRAAVGGVLPY